MSQGTVHGSQHRVHPRQTAVGDEAFGPIEDVVVPVPMGGGAHGGSIGTGVGLREAEGRVMLFRHDVPPQRLLLLCAAQHYGQRGQAGGPHGGGYADITPSELFLEYGKGQLGQLRPAKGLGHIGGVEPHLDALVVEGGWHFAGAVVLAGVGDDFLVYKLAHHGAQFLNFLGDNHI